MEKQEDITYTRINSDIVRAHLKINKNALNETQHPNLVIALDISSSMSSNGFYSCCEAVNKIMAAHGKNTHLVTYCHWSKNYICQKVPSDIKPTGTTSFTEALNGVKLAVKHILANDDSQKPIEIIFFTDGQNNKDCESLPLATEILRNRLSILNARVHAIGIEANSDSHMMSVLTSIGGAGGTYGYFKCNDGSLELEVERLLDLIRPSLMVEYDGKKIRLDNQGEAIVFIRNKDVECPDANLNQKVEYLQDQIEYMSKNSSTIKLVDVQKVQDQAHQIFKAAGKLPRVARKKLRSSLQPINQIITQMFNIVERGVKSNEQLAMLMVNARNARTGRFLRKTAARAEHNAEIISKEDSQIQMISTEYISNSTELDNFEIPKYSDGELFEGICMLSTQDPKDLIQDGDCLGIALEADASEICIMDPTRLRIKRISPSFMGCDGFLEAANWSLNQGNDISYSSSTNIVVDAARQNVNGVMPLYLNDKHWKIAACYVRRMSGQLCCKDPLQGTAKHAFYTYLMILKYLDDKTDTFSKHLAEKVLETLRVFYSKHSTVLPSPNEFMNKIEMRLPNYIRDLDLAIFAWNKLDIIDSKMLKYVTEEKIRRQDQSLCLKRDNIFKLGNVDTQKWIIPYVESNTPKRNEFPDFIYFQSVLKDMLPETCHNQILFELGQSPNQSKSNISQNNYSLQIKDYKLNLNLPQDWLNKFPEEDPRRVAMVYIQAARQKNCTVRENSYQDIFVMPITDIELKLNKFIQDAIKTERNSRLSMILQSFKSKGTESRLARMVDASLIQIAAMMYSDCYLGRNITKYYLAVPNYEALKMVIEGTFVPAVFFRDCLTPDQQKIMKPHEVKLIRDLNCRWIPCNRNIARLWRQKSWLTEKMLCDLFPYNTGHISRMCKSVEKY